MSNVPRRVYVLFSPVTAPELTFDRATALTWRNAGGFVVEYGKIGLVPKESMSASSSG